MGRAPCCSKVGLQRGPWTANEDELLIKYIQDHGEGQWRSLPKKAGLLRCGKSCRLRWMNYLRPDIKRGNITSEEDVLIIRLHGLLGNRWSLIAGRLPGRTDNEIKNYWNTHLSKRLRSQGTDPNTHKKLSESELEKQAMNYNKKKCRRSSINNKNHTRITKIHLPKPIRAKSIISLASNNSNISLESSNLSTTSASSSQNQTLSQTLNQNHGLTTTFNNNNNNNNNSNSSSILDMPWLSNNNASMESNGIDDQLMMTIGQSFDNHEVSLDAMKIHDNNQVPENNNNNNQQLEKLYEEYLQLIKVDDDDDVDDGDVDDQLDSFTESFFI